MVTWKGMEDQRTANANANAHAKAYANPLSASSNRSCLPNALRREQTRDYVVG